VSNILVVESENDKYFVEALIEHDGKTMVEYECLAGLSAKKLKSSLFYLKKESLKRNIQKIGIILDMDNETETSRLQMVNTAIQDTFETKEQASRVRPTHK